MQDCRQYFVLFPFLPHSFLKRKKMKMVTKLTLLLLLLLRMTMMKEVMTVGRRMEEHLAVVSTREMY